MFTILSSILKLCTCGSKLSYYTIKSVNVYNTKKNIETVHVVAS